MIHQHTDAKRKTKIADAVDQECLHVGEDRRWPGVPKTDEQIRHQANSFPTEKQLQEVVGHHKHHHREGKKRDVGEKALITIVVFHVTHGVDVHTERHRGHHHHHHGGDRVNQKTNLKLQIADLCPLIKRAVKAVASEHVQ